MATESADANCEHANLAASYFTARRGSSLAARWPRGPDEARGQTRCAAHQAAAPHKCP